MSRNLPDPGVVDAIGGMAVEEYKVGLEDRFVQHLLDTAEHLVEAPTADRDAVVEALETLHRAGYRTGGRDRPDASGFASMSDYRRLLDEQHAGVRRPETTEHGVESLRVESARFFASAGVSEGTMLLVHPAAAVPAFPGSHERPWLLSDPEGAVVVGVRG